MKAIEISHLFKTYKGKRGSKVEALSDLCLEIDTGEVFGFLGPNGAGKSTTIRTVMGQIKPTSGCAKIFGTSVTITSSRLKVGYLPENPAFYDFLTAREYLMFVGRTFGMSDNLITSESDRILKLLELGDSCNRSIRGFSKGMVQRLGLAQAMLHDPDLYILDEPMSGLDPIGRALVKDIIKDLKDRGKTIFFSTHVTADIEAVCDKVGVIVKGRLETVDKVENILRSGIEGYSILLSNSGNMEKVYVDKHDLKRFMEKVTTLNVTIECIEQKRKDMESFFLDIVSKDKDES